MTLTVTLLLIFLGLLLLLLEILVLPGMIAGIIGGCLILFGIISAYVTFGNAIGNYVLLGTSFTSVIIFYLAFRSDTWKKVSLHSTIDGKVNTFTPGLIKVGDKGVTLSRLAPMGKALINEMNFEVQSMEGFTNENTPIIVVKVDNNKIIVKTNNN